MNSSGKRKRSGPGAAAERSGDATSALSATGGKRASGRQPARAARRERATHATPLAPAALVLAEYKGLQVAFTSDGWFDATRAAARFGKKPAEWRRLPETRRYVRALTKRAEVGKSHFARSERGGRGGGSTWLHPKLAVRFAQWLSVDFAVWCDEQIERLLRGQTATLFSQRMELERRDAASHGKAAFGSRLMRDRKQELRAIRRERARFDSLMQPFLFPRAEEA